jgi:hypothetical protein
MSDERANYEARLAAESKVRAERDALRAELEQVKRERDAALQDKEDGFAMLQRERDEAQAGAAAMREALNSVIDGYPDGEWKALLHEEGCPGATWPDMRDDENPCVCDGDCDVERVEKTLASTAGTELLARLAAAEKALAEANEDRANMCANKDSNLRNLRRVEGLLDAATAEAAELRRVLEEVRAWRRAAVGLEPTPNTDAETLGARIDAALSGTAGAALLAEVERMREALESIRRRAEARPVHVCDVDTFDFQTIALTARAALSPEPKEGSR